MAWPCSKNKNFLEAEKFALREQTQALRTPQGGEEASKVVPPPGPDWLQDAKNMQSTVPAIGDMLVQYHQMVKLMAAAMQAATATAAPRSTAAEGTSLAEVLPPSETVAASQGLMHQPASEQTKGGLTQACPRAPTPPWWGG